MAFKINFVTPDNGEKYIVEMSGATLSKSKDIKPTNLISRSQYTAAIWNK